MTLSLIAGTVTIPSGCVASVEKKKTPERVKGVLFAGSGFGTETLRYLMFCFTSTQPVTDARIDAKAEALASISSTVRPIGAQILVIAVLPVSSLQMN
jgi:hypothetical protein